MNLPASEQPRFTRTPRQLFELFFSSPFFYGERSGGKALNDQLRSRRDAATGRISLGEAGHKRVASTLPVTSEARTV